MNSNGWNFWETGKRGSVRDGCVAWSSVWRRDARNRSRDRRHREDSANQRKNREEQPMNRAEFAGVLAIAMMNENEKRRRRRKRKKTGLIKEW